MKKIILLVLGILLGGVGLASAAPASGLLTPSSCAPVAIDNVVVTEITGNTSSYSTTAGVDFVKVTNPDSANGIWCSGDSAVAISGTTHLGDYVAFNYGWLTWSIGRVQKWYCLAKTAPVTAVVCLHKS